MPDHNHGRNPEPLDESLPPAEIRGGNRPEDYIPPLPQFSRDAAPDYGVLIGIDDEPPGGNDPDAQ